MSGHPDVSRLAASCAAPLLAATLGAADARPQPPTATNMAAPNDSPAEHNAVELSPVSPFIRIYAVQYARRVGEHTEALGI